jgi:hypothetical protein
MFYLVGLVCNGPEGLDDRVGESNPVRGRCVRRALELRDLRLDGINPAATGQPAYHPSSMLKLYIHGYLNRVQSSRRLEREAVHSDPLAYKRPVILSRTVGKRSLQSCLIRLEPAGARIPPKTAAQTRKQSRSSIISNQPPH